MMDRIVRETERNQISNSDRHMRRRKLPISFTSAIAKSTCCATADIGARLISKYRPTKPMLTFTPNTYVFRRLYLYSGIAPRVVDFVADTENMVARIDATLQQEGLAKHGETHRLRRRHTRHRAG